MKIFRLLSVFALLLTCNPSAFAAAGDLSVEQQVAALQGEIDSYYRELLDSGTKRIDRALPLSVHYRAVRQMLTQLCLKETGICGGLYPTFDAQDYSDDLNFANSGYASSLIGSPDFIKRLDGTDTVNRVLVDFNLMPGSSDAYYQRKVAFILKQQSDGAVVIADIVVERPPNGFYSSLRDMEIEILGLESKR